MTSRGKSRVGSSPDATTERTLDCETLLRALEHGSRESPKLGPLWEMVQRTATMASTVVKGTDSQRTFNVEFANLCRTCLASAGELEDAAFEMANPGRRAWDARSDEIPPIEDADLLRALSQHVASRSTAFTPQYLEHIASSAAQKIARNNRKRERPAAMNNNGISHARAAGAPRAAARTESRRTPSTTMPAPDDGSLGLLDESATTQAALQQLLANHGGSATSVLGEGSMRTAASSLVMSDASSATTSLFHSKASARTRNATGKTFDLRNPSLRLSAIPELSKRLQPWLLSMPQYDGLAVDRVVPEKDRRAPPSYQPHSHSQNNSNSNSGNGGGAISASTEPTSLTTLDVCGAQAPHDLLKRWEAREMALAALRTSLAGPVTGAVSTSSAPPAPPPPPQQPRLNSPPRETDSSSAAAAANKGCAEGDDGVPCAAPFFVNSSKIVTASVPKAVIAAQVHFGVWKLEFPQYSRQ